MPHVDTDALRIHYRVAGSGPTTVVLVHGNFATSRWWEPLLQRLPPGVVAYAPDLRGCGRTDRSMLGYEMSQLSADLLAFTESMSLAPFHLVGQSLGGAVAQQFVLDSCRDSEGERRVHSLLLLAPVPAAGLEALRDKDDDLEIEADKPVKYLRETAHLSLFTLLQATGLYGLNRVLLRRAFTQMTPNGRLDADAIEDLVEDAAQISPAAIVGFYRSLEHWNVQDRLGEIDIPTTILWGQRDSIVPLKGLQDTALALAQGRLEIWPDVGHAPQFEKPDQVIRLLEQVMDRGSRGQRLKRYAWRLRKSMERFARLRN